MVSKFFFKTQLIPGAFRESVQFPQTSAYMQLQDVKGSPLRRQSSPQTSALR
jgi:hypothetical protein